MAFHTEKDGFPPIKLTAGMQIRVEAVHPTTGDPVAGVSADRWMIYGADESELPDEPFAAVEWLEVPS